MAAKMADWITAKQLDEAREAFRRFNEATGRATDAMRKFSQNAADICGDCDLEDSDWEESTRQRTHDNLRDAFG